MSMPTSERGAMSAHQLEALLAAGDRLAHELCYSEHKAVLDAWWIARGGWAKCTVCHEHQREQGRP